MVERLQMNMKRCARKQSWSVRGTVSFSWRDCGKQRATWQYSRSICREPTAGTPDHEAGVLTTTPWRSV